MTFGVVIKIHNFYFMRAHFRKRKNHSFSWHTQKITTWMSSMHKSFPLPSNFFVWKVNCNYELRYPMPPNNVLRLDLHKSGILPILLVNVGKSVEQSRN